MSNALSEEEEFEFRLRLEQEQGQARPSQPAPEDIVEEAPASSLADVGKSLARQVGLTARAGIEGVAAPAAVLGDVAGLRSSESLRNLLTKIGLPVPESDTEKFVGTVAGGMAGAGGMTGLARGIAAAAPTSVTGQVASRLAEAPGMSVAAGGAATAAGEGASAAGADPVTSFLTALGVGAAVPSAATGVKALGASAKDVVNALRAAFGSEKAITNVTEDAVAALTEGQRQQILDALNAAKPTAGAKPTVAEAVAARNVDVPGEQVGGAVIAMQKRLRGAKGVEDVIPTAEAQQEQAVAQYIRNLDERTTPMRSAALGAARSQGTQALSVLVDMAKLSGRPGFRNKVSQAALQRFARQIRDFTDDKTGFIDPADLYTVRKDINKELHGIYSKMQIPFDKAVAGQIERSVRASIDDAIEASGGTGWKRYLQTYEEGMRPVHRREAVLEKKADIEKIVEPRTVAEIAEAELPTLPTLLHRPTMAVNFALRLIAKDITDPVQKELAKRMTDPEKFAELMRRPAASPARRQADLILARAGILASLIGQHQQDQSPQE